MDGFDERDRELPKPPVPVADGTREQLKLVVAAMIRGDTPEEIAGHLEDGFPEDLATAAPLEDQERGDHVDLLLAVLQAPSLAAA
jgi:hypothetical protein